MSAWNWTPAVREQAYARIGLVGPPGSGKTKTALRMADGLAQGGKVAVVDTEHRAALFYAPAPDRPDLGGHTFAHLPMDEHDPRFLIDAVAACEHAGVAVLVVDSWSQFWAGRGGILELVDQAGAARNGRASNAEAWRSADQIHTRMVDALLSFRGHVIVTLRTKPDYVASADPGRTSTKVGLKPVQREGVEYDLDLVLDMCEGVGVVTKSQFPALAGRSEHHPGEELAVDVLEELAVGADRVQVILDELCGDALTLDRARRLYKEASRRRLLATPVTHPWSGARTVLEDVLNDVGAALADGPGRNDGPPVRAVDAATDPSAA